VDAAAAPRDPVDRWDEDPATARVVLSPRARRESVLRGLEHAELAGLSRRQRIEVLRRDPATAQSWLGLIPLPTPAGATGPARLELPIAALRRFLECPLQGWARAVLGLVEEDTRDVVSCEDEPLACDRLPAAILLGDVFKAQMAQGAETVTAAALDARLAQAADRAELAGTLPAGAFGHSERLRLRGILEAWRVRFSWANLIGPVEPVCFGRADEGARVRAIESPLVLDLTDPAGKPLQVVLFGQTQPVNEEATYSFKLVMRGHASAADHLGAWVDHVVLAAGGLGGGEGLTSMVIGAPNLNKSQSFAPLTRESARAYLTALVGEMLWTSHAYFMPIEAVEEFHKNGGDLADVAEELRQSGHKTVRSDYGPVPHPRSYEPPSEHEGRAMLRRRLAPFLGALTVEEAIAEEPEE
jgi:exodeoxyribonuclease V gamma subunit